MNSSEFFKKVNDELKNREKQEILDMKNSSNEILKVDNVSSFNVESSFDDDKVNINTASKEELKTLSGIGDGLAEAIISYREENNGFNTIDDIKNVSRIGDKTFEKFKDKIIV